MLTKRVLRAIIGRLLICVAVLVAAPVGAISLPGGSGTARIDGADQVALGAAKPADGRMVSSARKPEQAARLVVVLGLIPGIFDAPLAPTWSTLDSSAPAPTLPGRSIPSCKTSRGPPRHDALVS